MSIKAIKVFQKEIGQSLSLKLQINRIREDCLKNNLSYIDQFKLVAFRVNPIAESMGLDFGAKEFIVYGNQSPLNMLPENEIQEMCEKLSVEDLYINGMFSVLLALSFYTAALIPLNYKVDNKKITHQYFSKTQDINDIIQTMNGFKYSPKFGELSSILNVVIFILFRDSNDEIFKKEIRDIIENYNNDDFSFKKYILDYTYGKTSVFNCFLPYDSDFKNIIFYKDDKKSSYYKAKDQNNKNGFLNKKEAEQREFELLQKAINYADLNFNKDSKLDDLRFNQETIDNITFILSSTKDKITDKQMAILHPHHWNFEYLAHDDKEITLFGKRLINYNINFSDEVSKNWSTLVHEFFHSFGYPDLYRATSIAEGIGISGYPMGNLDLMDEIFDNFEIESKPLPLITTMYSKYTYGELGHAPIEIIKSGEYELYCMAEDHDGSKPVFAKIKSPFSENEFIYIEYRRRDDDHSKNIKNWDKSIDPIEGVFVYRVNEQIEKHLGNKYSLFKNREVLVPDHIRTYLLEEIDYNSLEINSLPLVISPYAKYEDYLDYKIKIKQGNKDFNPSFKSLGSIIKGTAYLDDLYLTNKKNSGIKITALEIYKNSEGKSKIKFRVDIADPDNPVYSNQSDLPIITKQPVSDVNSNKLHKGDQLTLTIDAKTDRGVLSYQWQVYSLKDDNWVDIKNANDKQFSIILGKSILGDICQSFYRYRCIVKNKEEGKNESRIISQIFIDSV